MDNMFMASNAECEDLENYQVGGLHPVNIGDDFEDGKFTYTIVHKLGFGASSTVWLARDHLRQKYVAMKILMARKSGAPKELEIFNHLAQKPPGWHLSAVTSFLDHFYFDGPNGRHFCLVLDVAGPSLNELLKFAKFRVDHVQDIVKQIAVGMKAVHMQRIVLGDVSTDNILLCLKDISSYDVATLYEKLGEPRPESVETLLGEELSTHNAPSVVYPSIDWQQVDFQMLSSEVKLADLNESVDLETDHESLVSAVKIPYASPEHLFMINTTHSRASDIWALACCMFELRSNEMLFPEWTAQSVRISIQRTMNALPQSWLEQITVDSSGRKIVLLSPEILEKSKDRLDRKIRRIGDWKPWFNMTVQQRRDALIAEFGEERAFSPDFFLQERINADPPPAKLSEEEFTDFYDLLSKMLRYRPEDRLTIRGVLEHPWLNKKYEKDFNATDPWISHFSWGQDISEAAQLTPVVNGLGSPWVLVNSTGSEG